MIPMEDHKRELAKKDEAIEKAKAEGEKIKAEALKTVKDYNERFKLQEEKVHLLDVKFAAEKQVHESIVADLERQIVKMNEKHGVAIKKLRDEADILRGEISALKTTLECTPSGCACSENDACKGGKDEPIE